MYKTEKYKLHICKLGERQATCQKKSHASPYWVLFLGEQLNSKLNLNSDSLLALFWGWTSSTIMRHTSLHFLQSYEAVFVMSIEFKV